MPVRFIVPARYSRRSAHLLAALAIASALSACEQPHPVDSDPRTLVITLADLPTGWNVDTQGTRAIKNPRDLTGDSTDTSPYTDHGWVSAYEADFLSTTSTGPRRIAVLVSEFGDPSGAAGLFEQGVGGQALLPSQDRLSAPPKLGERSQTFHQVVPSGVAAGSSPPESQYWFYWQDRNLLVRILVAGSPASVTESEAVDVAQQEARVLQRQTAAKK